MSIAEVPACVLFITTARATTTTFLLSPSLKWWTLSRRHRKFFWYAGQEFEWYEQLLSSVWLDRICHSILWSFERYPVCICIWRILCYKILHTAAFSVDIITFLPSYLYTVNETVSFTCEDIDNVSFADEFEIHSC